ncbi:hypothetical protein SS50377_26894 [Spironucleus salmonicida]|uniref:Uncharacterized protein n=1 Tax=Spironucleus salmonicida TaxID=348837 RepID=V6LUM5_9EUKA|nr:hypothetical protein SS50377_26894 [Spironucleus salmonicida]|eukprot:EST47406.1 Hypothetical protein SS50377_12392 [Spironucleus salmonicida]
MEHQIEKDIIQFSKLTFDCINMDSLQQKTYIPKKVGYNNIIQRVPFVPSYRSVLKQKSYYDLPGRIDEKCQQKLHKLDAIKSARQLQYREQYEVVERPKTQCGRATPRQPAVRTPSPLRTGAIRRELSHFVKYHAVE